jgi:hypothetical protein
MVKDPNIGDVALQRIFIIVEIGRKIIEIPKES